MSNFVATKDWRESEIKKKNFFSVYVTHIGNRLTHFTGPQMFVMFAEH